MTKVDFLEVMRADTEQAISDIIMPTKPQKTNMDPESRAAGVHKMRLPDSSAFQDKAPYIIQQIVTGKDSQQEGQRVKAGTTVRSIFCVYHEDEQEGALMLLNLMERLRIHWLKKLNLEERYILDLEIGLESLVYPENTAPFYAGEMFSTWKLPAVEREVREWL